MLRGANVYLKGILGAANHSAPITPILEFLLLIVNLVLEGHSVSLWADVEGTTLRGQVVNEPLSSFVFVGNGIACAVKSHLIKFYLKLISLRIEVCSLLKAKGWACA